MKNICEQVDCPYNEDCVCLQYREPVWELFGTKDCAINVNEMLDYEEAGEIK